MSTKNMAVLCLTVASFILGIIISMQVKAIRKQNIETVGLLRANEISVELNKALADKDELEVRIAEMEEKIKNYEQILAHESNDTALMIEEINKTRMIAGLTSLTGRGIELVLSDSKKKLDNLTAASALLIHDEDLLNIINELNAAGCEAIAINNQRFVSSSSVRCVGPVISVNNVRIAAPYTIHAIGNPEVLESALRLPGGVIDSLAPWGIEISVKKVQNITVPKYDGNFVYVEAAAELEEIK